MSKNSNTFENVIIEGILHLLSVTNNILRNLYTSYLKTNIRVTIFPYYQSEGRNWPIGFSYQYAASNSSNIIYHFSNVFELVAVALYSFNQETRDRVLDLNQSQAKKAKTD